MPTSTYYRRVSQFFRSGVQGPVVRAIPTAIGVVILNFILLQMVPGDAVDALVAEAGSATAETTQLLRH